MCLRSLYLLSNKLVPVSRRELIRRLGKLGFVGPYPGFAEYVKAAMEKASYEIIDDPEPFYGEIPELQGVWSSGNTLEACRDTLMSALEDWIAFRLRTGRSIPSIG